MVLFPIHLLAWPTYLFDRTKAQFNCLILLFCDTDKFRSLLKVASRLNEHELITAA
jgi:hypothetical protein